MNEFKVGDRVRLLPNPSCCEDKVGQIGTIEEVGFPSGYPYQVRFSSDIIDWHKAAECELELAEPDLAANKPKQTITMKITNAFKKFLSPELQAQVKAGYRDDGLNLTSEGKTALLEILATSPAGTDYAAEFTKAAQDAVAEAEKAA